MSAENREGVKWGQQRRKLRGISLGRKLISGIRGLKVWKAELQRPIVWFKSDFVLFRKWKFTRLQCDRGVGMRGENYLANDKQHKGRIRGKTNWLATPFVKLSGGKTRLVLCWRGRSCQMDWGLVKTSNLQWLSVSITNWQRCTWGQREELRG